MQLRRLCGRLAYVKILGNCGRLYVKILGNYVNIGEIMGDCT